LLVRSLQKLRFTKKLFDARYDIIKSNNPSLPYEEIFLETAKLVSPVINLDGSRNIPPHSTGAAIDVYLVDKDKQIVDMGIRAADWMQDIDGSISKTNSSIISSTAKHNRKIMSNALTKAGFVNYLGEYWHWSYGDRYWAYFSQKSKAIYGTIL
jgi:zinc D-Ala-D-Ala dipeptidase